jgi:hypothetical protein
LVDTRLVIQANLGGGKSWLLRLIAGRPGIQTIVLDNEGEFACLREAVDVLLVGAGGELAANPRHAALLARRLLEYKVSAVVDSVWLKLLDRRRFVKLFLDALVHLPRELWRPVLVILYAGANAATKPLNPFNGQTPGYNYRPPDSSNPRGPQLPPSPNNGSGGGGAALEYQPGRPGSYTRDIAVDVTGLQNGNGKGKTAS